MDRIYKKMNIANSSVGQESLYKMLRIPSDIKKLKETDRLASFFASDKEKKICAEDFLLAWIFKGCIDK